MDATSLLVGWAIGWVMGGFAILRWMEWGPFSNRRH